MFEGLSEASLMALVGLIGGVALGLAARLGRFCTLGAIEDFLYQGSDLRLRMWGLAIGVAGVTTYAMIAGGMINPAMTIYFTSPFSPLASIIGGLLFGYGMSLAGNCGFGALARCGGGDLRSFVIVLVMGIAAYFMLSGPLGALRQGFVDLTQVETSLRSYPLLIETALSIPATVVGLILSGGLAAAALASSGFRANRKLMFWGTLVGLAVAGGFAGTQWVVTHSLSAEPVRSFTFTAPLGETMLYLMTASGGGLSFGVGSVFGVLAGAFIGSLFKGHFRWEACEDPRELKRQFAGAICMGFGAVLALGCTIGQGISAMALLSLSAPITFAAIFAGAAIGLRQLITGFARSA